MNVDFKTQYSLNFASEIIVDLFAGGGGASTGIEMGTGRPVDIAINHDPDAISQHTANHPGAEHYISDVFEVDPVEACRGRPVGHLHASPDCTHHSQAAGGQPRKKAIRSLSWVVLKWAGKVRPRIITLENVEQILQWSPLVAKRCKDTGRVITLELVKCPSTGRMVNRVAAPGERVPVENQFLTPNKKRRGHNWNYFVSVLRDMGYVVRWRKLKACDYGAGTTRERLYMVARCDGVPITWPNPTHAKKPTRGQKKLVAAADCIDWSIPSQSIFDRPRPLAAATMRRIARGVQKYVIEAAEPYIVSLAHGDSGSRREYSVHNPLGTIMAEGMKYGVVDAKVEPFIVTCNHGGENFRGQDVRDPMCTITAAHDAHGVCEPILAPIVTEHANSSNSRSMPADEPLRTITGAPKGGSFAVAAATLVQTGYGEREGQAPRCLDIRAPLGTVMGGGQKHAVTTAYLAQMNGGFNDTAGHDARSPMSTITNTGSQQQLVSASLVHLRGNCDARPADEPLRTLSAGGNHHGVIECKLSPEAEKGALRCAAFLMQYYGEGGSQHADLRDPMNAVTTRDRLALVTVWVQGSPYVIVDICLRMLQPRELYLAQGFPGSYIIDHGHDGRVFPKYKKVRFVGNSVSPLPMAHICRALHSAAANDNQAISMSA